MKKIKKILCISPVLSHPPNRGNKVHITGMLSALQQCHCQIHFLHIGFEQDSLEGREETAQQWDKFFFVEYKRSSLLRAFAKHEAEQKNGVYAPWGIDDWFDSGVEPFVEDLQKNEQYDMVIVQYIFFSKIFSCFDRSIFKVLNTLNVFTNRQNMFIQYGVTPSNFYTSLQQEKIALDRADLICAIQEDERVFLQKMTEKPVITVGNPVRRVKPKTLYSPTNKTLLFVGSQHIPNQISLNHFLEHIYPEIFRWIPDISLQIVGSIFQGSFAPNVLPEGCHYCGVVDDLDKWYLQAAVVINPILFGTGLSIKLIEALGYGKPIVTTTVGARGLSDGRNQAFVVADSDMDFAHAVVKLLNDPVFANSIANEAWQFVARYNQACQESILKILDQI